MKGLPVYVGVRAGAIHAYFARSAGVPKSGHAARVGTEFHSVWGR